MMTAQIIHAAETTRDGITTYYFTDDIDCLPPDARNYHMLNHGTLAQVREAIAHVEAGGFNVCWQVGSEIYETE